MPAPMLQPSIPHYILGNGSFMLPPPAFFFAFAGASWVHIARTILVKTAASVLTVWMDLFVSVKQAFVEKGK